MSTGQCSFAHAAFWGIGAYASALFTMKIGLSFWISLPLAGIIAAVFAIPIGLICLRLKGPYFFIITLAFGQIILLTEKSWVSLTGGTNGISGVPAPNAISIAGFTIQFLSKASFLYLIMFLMLITLFVMYRLERSRFGMTCEAIRETDALAETVGIDILRYKMMAFVAACFFAGIAGGFYAHYLAYVAPDYFSSAQSLNLLIYMMVGGVSSATGAILGTTIVTIVHEVFRPIALYEPIVFGFILIMVLMFVPGGLLSLLKKIPTKHVVNRFKERPSAPAGD